MAKNFAYDTYKKVEAASNFSSQKEKEKYALTLLKRTEENELPFIRKHIGKIESVLEVGSGSGRILHAMLLAGLAQEALGLEISPSRIRFGKEWAKFAKIKGVEHKVADVLKKGAVKGSFDAILCVTSIYPFFDMLEKNGLEKFLTETKKHLNPGGVLMLESVTFSKEIEHCRVDGGVSRVWEEYRKGDPFRFNLIEYQWDEKKRHLTALSYNVMRDRLFVDGPSVKKWHMQTGASLKSLLVKLGYRDIRFFGDFDSSPYKEGKSHRCVVIAKK